MSRLTYSVNKKGKDLKLISQSSTGKTCEKVTRKAIWPYIAKQLSSQSSFNCSNRTSAGYIIINNNISIHFCQLSTFWVQTTWSDTTKTNNMIILQIFSRFWRNVVLSLCVFRYRCEWLFGRMSTIWHTLTKVFT